MGWQILWQIPKQGVVGAERRVEGPGARGPEGAVLVGYKGGPEAKQYVVHVTIGHSAPT